MRVPFLDLRAQHARLVAELTEVFRRIVRDAAFVGGPEVEAFERDFAAFCRSPGAVAVNSGTDALRFAYLAMGIGPGDEVVTVPNTFIATTEALAQTGAQVRFVDVLPGTLLMDPAQLAQVIGSRTVGIVPVHLFGMPVEMDAIEAIARERHLWVIEDAAQAHGAEYRGRRCGSMGAVGAFSFYPGKNLGACGEAGALTSGDVRVLDMARKLRDHGQSAKYYHDIEGYNGRMDALQAAFLRVKLSRLNEWNQRRRQVARWYRERLSAIPDVQPLDWPDHVTPVYHLFVVRVPERAAAQIHLLDRGIGTGVHYPVPLHLQRAYQHLGLRPGAFPVAEAAAAEILSLPMFPELSEQQVDYVVEALATFFVGKRSGAVATSRRADVGSP